ncbi:hypothetical protein [Tropicimonas isoalkanivorans]|uniref:Excalibur calcium-binding domain-containing protein n=1 Tax=Tropicimonas isoalkanivorans TaxID=441112 RepID=A0A1I1JHP7_9RHOB|nr:hypothetical protein [Tropicimonas isoalkanivorans]SFC47996.1 hypothetical protein SAMN04488094_105131 [Tropicimonas isoalkanivorans]
MRRLTVSLISLLAVSACEPTVPDSASGVGFGDYTEYRTEQARIRAAREAQLSGRSTILPPERTGAPSAKATSPSGISSAELAQAGIGPAPTPAAPAPSAPPAAGAVAQPGLITPAPGTPLAATAEGAAFIGGQPVAAAPAGERLQAQPVPNRPSSTGPDIVAFALQTSNAVGQQVYSRSMPSQAKAQRNCANYPSPDLAQRAFLSGGGPQRDRYGIDPDGDGFVCGWSPEPFRRAVGR